jgi:hypothetical protein
MVKPLRGFLSQMLGADSILFRSKILIYNQIAPLVLIRQT